MAPGVKRALPWAGGAAIGLAAGLSAFALAPAPPPRFVERAPDPAKIAEQVREGLRAQGALTVLTARYVALVEAKSGDFVFETKRTLLMPGQARYLVDLRGIGPRDLRWEAATRTLHLTLPPIALAGPQVDLGAVKVFGEGGLLAGLGDAAERLDANNRLAAQNDLIRQAHAAEPMDQARAAARKLVGALFAAPLQAAGQKPKLDIRFADEPR
ncbi:MAG: hypothetical protein A4S12_12210 [Proteobacteria bacterium SG_bin5]|nr:MAG: hypothetical protein A4S12_12210 [Proteobacteria bacterium SG_bin5]